MSNSDYSFLAELRFTDGTEEVQTVEPQVAATLQQALDRGVRGRTLMDHLSVPQGLIPTRLKLVLLKHGEPILQRVFFNVDRGE